MCPALKSSTFQFVGHILRVDRVLFKKLLHGIRELSYRLIKLKLGEYRTTNEGHAAALVYGPNHPQVKRSTRDTRGVGVLNFKHACICTIVHACTRACILCTRAGIICTRRAVFLHTRGFCVRV